MGYTCKYCDVTCASLRLHARHQRDAHSLDRRFVFSCPESSCQHHVFMSFENLRYHIWQRHQDCEVPQGRADIQCSSANCGVRVTSMKALCHHLIDAHGRVREAIKCPFEFCGGGPFKLGSFRAHLSTHHEKWRDDHEETGNANDLPQTHDVSHDYQEEGASMRNSFAENPASSESEANEDPSRDTDNFYHQVAKFYLKLEAECMLPTSTVQTISEGLFHLLHLNLGIMKKTIKAELKDLDLVEEERDQILNNILCSDKLYCAHVKEAPGPTLSTPTLRTTYYKKEFSFLDFDEIDIGEDPDNPRCVYFFSVKKTLNAILSCPSVQEQVDQSFLLRAEGSNGDVLSDYTDGLLFRNSECAKQKTIDIILFLDAFNPLKDMSSVADKYDTLGVYMTLGNFKPHIRSKLQSMLLVQLIPQFKQMWKDFGEGCFKKLNRNLKQLEIEGVLYKNEKVPVVVQVIIGDNKGQNQIGGLVDCFTAFQYCRFCPMSRDDIRETPWEVRSFRTKQDVQEDLQVYQDLLARGENVAHYNGVKSTCIFKKLKYVDHPGPRLCPCLAHDIFEAIVDKYDFFEILEYLMNMDWFSLKTLNKLIKKFQYGNHDICNKPSSVKTSKVGGHAIQNWTLLRLLPFILGKNRILDPSDPYWQLYLKLKEICEYVCAPKISKEQIADLKVMIEDYLKDIHDTLASVVKPKHHFINHYAWLMYLLGPLIHLMTMRFESVHRFFKQTARTARNTINLGLTMSKKAQLYFCYLSTGFYINDGISFTGEKKLNIDAHNEAMQNILRHQNFSPNAEEVDTLQISSLDYAKDQWLLLGYEGDSIKIIVGHIKCLVVDGNRTRVIVERHVAKRWVDYGIYKIKFTQPSDQLCSLNPKELDCPVTQEVYMFDGKLCFSLKHILAVTYHPSI